MQLAGDNAAVQDVELINCWNCINATQAARHYVARVQGQPINIGVFVDKTYDIGRIEDVHFNPWVRPRRRWGAEWGPADLVWSFRTGRRHGTRV